ncbi:MAG: hypothetical protein JWR33_2236 [Naasia sp.]|jgi:hypothetical protein|uniref:SPOR domain-containing protein n=1 Tax=Naasia sp. TaxID=2546198 RepID=UPI00261B15D4|nr:SPOR domain-containing protein [Naasia sp.]MCU1571495.1 hypothetical protein [Naasia sp.]
MADEAQYWYNSRTGQVERGKLSNAIDRVGPFATHEEAERAPEKLRQNAERWAAEDAAEA